MIESSAQSHSIRRGDEWRLLSPLLDQALDLDPENRRALIQAQDPEIADLAQHAPALLSSLIQKLERLYMTIAERDPTDPALQIMPVVSRRAKEMRASLEGRGGGVDF